MRALIKELKRSGQQYNSNRLEQLIDRDLGAKWIWNLGASGGVLMDDDTCIVAIQKKARRMGAAGRAEVPKMWARH